MPIAEEAAGRSPRRERGEPYDRVGAFVHRLIPFVAAASCRVNAFNAVLDIEYAGAYSSPIPRLAPVTSAILDSLI